MYDVFDDRFVTYPNPKRIVFYSVPHDKIKIPWVISDLIYAFFSFQMLSYNLFNSLARYSFDLIHIDFLYTQSIFIYNFFRLFLSYA